MFEKYENSIRQKLRDVKKILEIRGCFCVGSGRSDADGNDGLKDAEGKGKVWEPGHDWRKAGDGSKNREEDGLCDTGGNRSGSVWQASRPHCF